MTWWNSTLGLFTVFKQRRVAYLLAVLETVVVILAVWKFVEILKSAPEGMRSWRKSGRFLLRGL